MKCTSITVVTVMLVAMVLVGRLCAQDKYRDDTGVNTNLAFSITTPLGPTSRLVHVGGGIVAGAGYNFSKRHAFVGEFMWNRLNATDTVLAPLRAALKTRNVEGRANVLSVTANYRFELRGKTTGVYFIGGGGWYHFKANASTPVATGSSTTCTSEWLRFGFECSSGLVVSDQTVATATADSLGVNAGVGITFKVAEPRYRIYVEGRYHYAPTENVKTELLPISIGIRF